MVSKIKHQQSKTQENQTVQLFLSFMLHADLDSKPTAFPWAKLFSYSCWAHIFFSIEWGISCVLVNTLYVDGKVFIRRFLESFNFFFENCVTAFYGYCTSRPSWLSKYESKGRIKTGWVYLNTEMLFWLRQQRRTLHGIKPWSSHKCRGVVSVNTRLPINRSISQSSTDKSGYLAYW